MIARYLVGAALSLALLAGGWAYMERQGRRDAEQQAASLARSVAVLSDARDQARLAAEVARAAADRERMRAAEYDALREALITGGDDAEVPDWFCDYLDGLLGGLRGDAGICAGAAGRAGRAAPPR